VKSFVRTFLLTAVLGAIVWGFYFGVIRGSSPFRGIPAGLILGLGVAWITRFRQKKVADSPPMLRDESLLREGPAMHDGMAGRLYLTDRRILFEGYPTDETAPEISRIFEGSSSDDPATEVSIPMLRIAEVKERGFGVRSCLDIVLADGETKYFGIEDLNEWVDDISTARQKLLDAPRSESMKLFP
jgi:hypothetical protein